MRIISGQAGRIQLKTPPGLELRPTGDRVKESLFSTLGPLTGQTVVDLFAGTGALGLEALSRGATQVLFVEREHRHLAFLRQNVAAVLKALSVAEGDERVRVIPGDVRIVPRRLAELAGQVDLILADPPYATERGEYGPAELLSDPAFAAWAGPNALLVLEHAQEITMPWTPATPWHLLKQKRFGRTIISFARQTDA